MELPYLTVGDPSKTPLLFLHGILGNKEDWHPIVKEFCETHYCICVDLPGHGEALFSDDSFYHMQSCSNALIQLLRRMNLVKTILLGYSMGGRVALHTVIKYPNLFSKLILESTSLGFKTQQECILRVKQDEKLASNLEENSLLSFLNDWYQQSMFNSLDGESKTRMINQRLRNSPKHLAKAFRGFSPGRSLGLWKEWEALCLPIYLFIGNEDEKFLQIAHKMAHLNSHCQLAIFKNAGHNIHFENPQLFCDELKKVLK